MESFKVILNGNDVFLKSKPHNDLLSQICGNDNYESRDVIHEVTFKVFHSSPTLYLEFVDTLD